MPRMCVGTVVRYLLSLLMCFFFLTALFVRSGSARRSEKSAELLRLRATFTPSYEARLCDRLLREGD